jgi:hypothetical protein
VTPVRVTVVVLLLALGAVARAQIVNVQPLLGGEERPGFGGALEGALDWRTGNTRLLLVSGSAIARYRYGRQLAFVLLRGDLGVQGGDEFVNKDFEHVRYRFELLPRVHLESFGQHDRDEFRRLAVRWLWGAGPRAVLWASQRVDVAAGVGYMLEYERLQRDTEIDAGQATLAHRLSSYVVVGLRLGAVLRFAETVYAQPRVDAFEDVRVLSETELLLVVSARLGIKIAFALAYD